MGKPITELETWGQFGRYLLLDDDPYKVVKIKVVQPRTRTKRLKVNRA